MMDKNKIAEMRKEAISIRLKLQDLAANLTSESGDTATIEEINKAISCLYNVDSSLIDMQ